MGELTDAGMISPQTIGNRTHLAITQEGAQTLQYFGSRISESIRQEIDAYFQEHEMALRNDVAVQSHYYKSTSGEYEAHLVAKEHDITLIDLTLSVPTEEIASSICDNWQTKSEAIYQYLTRELF